MAAMKRKSHKKSRTGCFHCKAKRVKCDEHHPVCMNCIKKKAECVYPFSISPPNKETTMDMMSPDSPFVSSSKDSTIFETTSSPNSDSKSIITQEYPMQTMSSTVKMESGQILEDATGSVFNDQQLTKFTVSEYTATSNINLELINFVIKEMPNVLSQTGTGRELWVDGIKNAFFANMQFFHILMAIASLYKSYEKSCDLDQSKLYYQISKYHYGKSISLLQNNLIPQDHIQAEGSMYTSVLLPLYLIASPDFIIYGTFFFKIGRGVIVLWEHLKKNLPESFYKNRWKYTPTEYNEQDRIHGYNGFPVYLNEILKVQPFEKTVKLSSSDNKDQSLEESIKHQDLENFCYVEEDGEAGQRLRFHNVYEDALNLLYCQYIHVNSEDRHDFDYSTIITKWVVLIKEDFLKLIAANDPRCLLIVLHFNRLLISMNGIWWKDVAYKKLWDMECILESSGWKKWLEEHALGLNGNNN